MQVWLYLDRVKDGYARKLAHTWHEPFRVAELCGDHAVRLEIVGTPNQLFPVVHVLKIKQVVQFPDSPGNTLVVNCEDPWISVSRCCRKSVRRTSWLQLNAKWGNVWTCDQDVRPVMAECTDNIWCSGSYIAIRPGSTKQI